MVENPRIRIVGVAPGSPYELLICTPEVIPSKPATALVTGRFSKAFEFTLVMAPVIDSFLAVP